MQIKVSFHLPTKDFTGFDYKELPVKVSLEPGVSINEDPEYSVVMPDFMFEALADTEPRFKTVYDVNLREVSGCFSRSTLTRKFRKTQTSTSIRVLVDYLYELAQVLIDKHGPEAQTMKKKLFLRFTHSARHTSNQVNGAYRGEVVEQKFNYFTGYEVMTEKFVRLPDDIAGKPRLKKQYVSKIEYHSPGSSTAKRDTGFQEKDGLLLPLYGVNQTIENFENEFIIVDWTPEREAFCAQILQTFKDVNQRLDAFIVGLTSDKMDELIATTGGRLLALTSSTLPNG